MVAQGAGERRRLLRALAGQVAALRFVGHDRGGDRLGEDRRGRGVRRRLLDGLPHHGDLLRVEGVALSEQFGQTVEFGEGLPEDGGVGRAGIDERHGDLPLPQLQPQRVAERLHAELGRAVGAVDRQHQPPPDRADIDDPSVAAPDQRQEGLGHGERTDQVDLELHPEVLERLELERGRLDDARVVDQRGQAPLTHGIRDGCDGRSDRRRVGDVDLNGREPLRHPRRQGLCIGNRADPGEDVEALLRETDRGSRADAGGRAGHDHRTALARRTIAHLPPPPAMSAQCRRGPARQLGLNRTPCSTYVAQTSPGASRTAGHPMPRSNQEGKDDE